MKYAVYMRVSTQDQHLDAQRLALKAKAAMLQADGHAVEWREEVGSGSSMDRPVLQATMEDLRAGRLGGVLVYAIDRLGRSMSGMAQAFEEFRDLGANLISLKEGVDLSTEAGRLVANIMASVAQFERERMLTRTKAGIAAKKARGEKFPGGVSKRGKTYRLTPDQILDVRYAYKIGNSISFIAKELGCSRGTVKRICGS